MTLKKISEALKKAKENADGFSWVDEEFSDLLITIAEYLLQQEKYQSNEIPQGYVTIAAFERAYKFISAETLRDYCQDPAFFNECAPFKQGIWYVNEEKTFRFLKNKPCFKKRMERLGGSW